MQPTFDDLIYYIEEYDNFLISHPKRTLTTIRMQEEMKDKIVVLGRIYYKNAQMKYADIVRRYKKDMEIQNSISKSKVK